MQELNIILRRSEASLGNNSACLTTSAGRRVPTCELNLVIAPRRNVGVWDNARTVFAGFSPQGLPEQRPPSLSISGAFAISADLDQGGTPPRKPHPTMTAVPPIMKFYVQQSKPNALFSWHLIKQLHITIYCPQ